MVGRRGYQYCMLVNGECENQQCRWAAECKLKYCMSGTNFIHLAQYGEPCVWWTSIYIEFIQCTTTFENAAKNRTNCSFWNVKTCFARMLSSCWSGTYLFHSLHCGKPCVWRKRNYIMIFQCTTAFEKAVKNEQSAIFRK